MTTVSEVVRFCRFARANGFSAGVTETLASVDAVRAVDAESSKFALRGALCSSKEEWAAFDRLYESFLRSAPIDVTRPIFRNPRDPRETWVLTGRSADFGARESDRDIAGAGVHARLKKMDFSSVPQGDQTALEQLAQRLLRKMSW